MIRSNLDILKSFKFINDGYRTINNTYFGYDYTAQFEF